jgi:hypothetical protein
MHYSITNLASALIEVADNIYGQHEHGPTVLGVYFDLQMADDSASHDILLKKMYNYGVSVIVYEWSGYLVWQISVDLFRKVRINIHCIRFGVSQRSVQSPLFF